MPERNLPKDMIESAYELFVCEFTRTDVEDNSWDYKDPTQINLITAPETIFTPLL